MTQINEAQRASMEAINQKTEAVCAEVTRQANTTGQQIVSEVDSRVKAMGVEILQIKSSPVAAASVDTSPPG